MKLIDPFRYYPTVILCNGAYPSHSVPLQVLAEAETVICCDGAANTYINKGNIPTIIIGDGDSIDKKILEAHADIYLKNQDQETNDLTKSFNYLFNEKGISEISVVGATGGREDHTIGNVSLLLEYHKAGADVRIFTDTGVFLAISGTTSLDIPVGTQISIFNSNSHEIQAQGLKYPLYPFTNWWQGTLNESTAPTIILTTTAPILIYLTNP